MIKPSYILFLVAGLLLVTIGILVDRVGGFAIRTDDTASAVTFSFSQPAVRGVPLMIRWNGTPEQNVGVTMKLISSEETVVLGSGKLFSGFMRVTIPCAIANGSARVELTDSATLGILASSPIQILPPGPDCVR